MYDVERLPWVMHMYTYLPLEITWRLKQKNSKTTTTPHARKRTNRNQTTLEMVAWYIYPCTSALVTIQKHKLQSDLTINHDVKNTKRIHNQSCNSCKHIRVCIYTCWYVSVRRCTFVYTQKSRERERENLAADDNDGGKRVPESRQGVIGAVVTEESTSPLNAIDESNDAVHRR